MQIPLQLHDVLKKEEERRKGMKKKGRIREEGDNELVRFTVDGPRGQRNEERIREVRKIVEGYVIKSGIEYGVWISIIDSFLVLISLCVCLRVSYRPVLLGNCSSALPVPTKNPLRCRNLTSTPGLLSSLFLSPPLSLPHFSFAFAYESELGVRDGRRLVAVAGDDSTGRRGREAPL